LRAAAGYGAAALVRPPSEGLRGVYGSLLFALPPRALEMRRARPCRLPRYDVARMALLASRGELPRELVLAFHHDGVEREALVHLPPGANAGSELPVVLNFHGFTSDALEHADYTAMSSAAAAHGFAAVLPQGLFGWLGYRSWNAGDYWAERTPRPPDDLGFVRELMAALSSVFTVPRWFATGISNGGMLCYALASAMPGRFSAIAPVAAVDLSDAPLPPHPIGVFHAHGRNDGLVPHDDRVLRLASAVGGFGWKRTARESLLRFATRSEGATHHLATKKTRTYETWRSPDGSVATWVLHHGGHTWLGDGVHIGRQRAAVADGSREIVEFFRDQARVASFAGHHTVP
jgi:poly(3-hydroxybutyrate) depolymerase